jgi:5-methylcytosine-specific restriction endonuclease McrA
VAQKEQNFVFEKQCAKEKCKKMFLTRFSHQRFCCASCANSENQRLIRTRRPAQYCPECNKKMFHGSKKCSQCHANSRFGISIIETLSLEKVQKMAGYQANARVRNHARRVYAASSPSTSCEICRYDKHIEVCHIKPISSFDGETLIGVINQRQNLIGLCRNCHWELDNGLLTLVPSGGIEPQALPSA